MTIVTFRILGPLEALVDGRPFDLSRRRERALLGALLLNLGEVVSVDALIDSVWGERAPASARHLVHEYVSRIRGALGSGSLIVTRAPGYVVERDACELDAARFSELVGKARAFVASDDLGNALNAFGEALGLWRGDVLSDVALEGDALAAATNLDDQRRAARSERVDVGLALGRHHQLIPDLERAAAADPLDEQLRGQLMLALYRDGRQADALERYREGRRTLVEQVGIEPGAELRALEQAILRHDPALAPPSAGVTSKVNDVTSAPLPRASRRRRGVAAAASVVAVAGLATVAVLAAGNTPSRAAPVRGNAVAVVDAASARLIGSVPVTAPGALAFGSGSVWVSSPDARSVLRISPESRQVAPSIPLGVAAQSLAVAGSAVWALGSGPNDEFLTLERIDPTFGTVSRVRRLPTVVTGDTGSLSARGGTLLIAPRSGLLTKINPRNRRTIGRLDPNAAPSAAALGFGSSWLAYPEADLVVRVDSSGAITTIPVGRGPSAIAVGKRAVWVANALDGTVESINPATGAAIQTTHVGSAPTAIATDGDSVWVADGGDGKLVRIDERRNRVTATVDVGGSPQSLAVGDGKVWASVQTPPAAQPSGGTAVVSAPYMTTLDPGVEFNGVASWIDYATCAMLLNWPDEAGSGGLRLVPDAAQGLPTVSKDGRTYTFTIRRGMRFSPPSNQPVTAQTFKHTIERSLNPRLGDGEPPGQMFLRDVVGAPAYIAKKARHIAGVQAHGDRLTIRLTERAPDLTARLAATQFCAVPTDMPNHPVSGVFPSAGPYYVASATKRSYVLLRNPNYHGDRPHRLRRIEIVAGNQHALARIHASKLDYAIGGGVPAAQSARLESLYGAHSTAARRGRQRYFANRTLVVDFLDLNTRRPLFASARMRRAASYAIDRTALAANGGAFSTVAAPAQMNIPPGMPGFHDAHVYPLVPDVPAAQRLAGSGHHDAVLYCALDGGSPRAAQIIKNDLAAIGIDVHIHCVPGGEMWTLLSRPNEPWDIAIDSYGSNYDDPSEFINGLAVDDGFNFSHYRNPRLNRTIHAASRLAGVRRAQAYARIDLALTRDIVPRINFANPIQEDFFSARIGCQLYQPVVGMDLAALCIRPSAQRR